MQLNNKTGRFEGVAQADSPFFNNRPDPNDISLIVIHNISLPEGEFGTPYIHQLFAGELNKTPHPDFPDIDTQVSVHFFIDRQGQLTQYVSVFDRAWHAGKSVFMGRENCNDYSLGIELEGCDFLPFTEQQYTQLNSLLNVLLQEFPAITLDRIVGHKDISPGRKTDPGPCFDWQKLRASLKGVINAN